jgi:branched-chain amino acid transport system ATP-binding protein
MSILESQGVTKIFGGLVAVDNVDFRVEKGEIVGLIGPNGAGKTTFFNIISGFYRPDKGDVLFNGTSIVGMKPHRICKLGMTRTFQIVKPFPELTVLENVMMGAFNHRAKAAASRAKAMEVMELLGLAERAGDLAGNLPVAGRKRVEIAKALATEPQLMLLDEVMAGLTPAEMRQMIETVRRIRDAGVTMVIVEHVMPVIMNLCDRIYVLHHGEKIAEGTPEEIVSNRNVMEAYLGEDFMVEAEGNA